MTEGMTTALLRFTDAIYWKVVFALARVLDFLFSRRPPTGLVCVAAI